MGNITSQEGKEMKSPITNSSYSQISINGANNELTPTNNRFLLNDPRSPTIEISRTPIQVDNAPPTRNLKQLLKVNFVEDDVEVGYIEQVDPDENTRLNNFEEGVEAVESCQMITGESWKSRRTVPRSPLKSIEKRNVSDASSPVLLLRYKRLKTYGLTVRDDDEKVDQKYSY